jgi:hypothetical protein
MRSVWEATRRPWEAFPRWAEDPAPWPRALGRMLALRVPLAWAELLLGWWSFGAMVHQAPRLLVPLVASLGRDRGVDPWDIQGFLAQLPPVPGLAQVWPWLLTLAPVLLVGAWLHHAVWDHTFLWMLKGVDPKAGFRASLEAEAEALRVGSVGAAVGLLGSVPILGMVLGLPLALVALWFWVLRGYALAARHGCPPWKGILATVLHLVGAACLGLGLLVWMAFTLASALAGPP